MLINDTLTNNLHCWKYMDDGIVSIPVNNRSPDFSFLQATLDSLQAWIEVNKMSISHTKNRGDALLHLLSNSVLSPALRWLPPALSSAVNSAT